MTTRPDERAGVLAARVVWLDRYRRVLAILGATVVFLLLSYELDAIFGAQWPSVLGALVSVLFAAAAWWVVEVALAWITAFWETEHAQIMRDRGLPRAELVQRRH
jgi:hypothetical protein